MLQGVARARRLRQGTLGIILRLTTCVPMFFLQGVICRHALALIHPAPRVAPPVGLGAALKEKLQQHGITP